MSNENDRNPEQELREKIASRMHSIGHSNSKAVRPEQLQELKTAASRLDQLLKSNADHHQEALKSAAHKLDRLLLKIQKGKDITPDLRRRQDQKTENEPPLTSD